MMQPVQGMEVESSTSDEEGVRRRKCKIPAPCMTNGNQQQLEKLIADQIEERLLAYASVKGPSLKVKQVIPLQCEGDAICEVLVLLARRLSTVGPETSKPLGPTERELITSYLKSNAYPLHLRLDTLKNTRHSGCIAMAKFQFLDCRGVTPDLREVLMCDSSSDDQC